MTSGVNVEVNGFVVFNVMMLMLWCWCYDAGGQLVPLFLTPMCQKKWAGVSPSLPMPKLTQYIYSFWKVDEKFGQGPPPPLIWTKSKRTATFFRETTPTKTGTNFQNLIKLYSAFGTVSKTICLNWTKCLGTWLHKLNLDIHGLSSHTKDPLSALYCGALCKGNT